MTMRAIQARDIAVELSDRSEIVDDGIEINSVGVVCVGELGVGVVVVDEKSGS
jgi:hypothetical protein